MRIRAHRTPTELQEILKIRVRLAGNLQPLPVAALGSSHQGRLSAESDSEEFVNRLAARLAKYFDQSP